MGLREDVLAQIRDVPDFPKPGIVYKDITPVLQCPQTVARISDWLAASAPADVDVIDVVRDELERHLEQPNPITSFTFHNSKQNLQSANL